MLIRSLSIAPLLTLTLGATALIGCGAADPTGQNGESTSQTESAVDVEARVNATYSCTSPLGNNTVTVTYAGKTPASVAVGTKVKMSGFQAIVHLPASLVNQAISFGATSASGTATTLDIESTDAAHPTVNAAKTPIPFGPSTLVQNQPLLVDLPASAEKIGAWSASTAGTMTFTPGAVTLDVTLTGLGTATVTCTATTTPTISTTTVK